MVAVPSETPVTKPPGELTVAIVGSELDQVTESSLIFVWTPSEYMPYAASRTVSLLAIVAEAGLTHIVLREGCRKKPPPQPVRNANRNSPTATVRTGR
jgi:hypothetical protein